VIRGRPALLELELEAGKRASTAPRCVGSAGPLEGEWRLPTLRQRRVAPRVVSCRSLLFSGGGGASLPAHSVIWLPTSNLIMSMSHPPAAWPGSAPWPGSAGLGEQCALSEPQLGYKCTLCSTSGFNFRLIY